MKKLSFYVTALVAGVLASCSNVEDVQTSQNEMEDFVAVVAEGGTRTSLDTNGFGVLWTADGENKDALAIFRQKGKGYNTKYEIESVADNGSATFSYANVYTPNDAPNVTLTKNYAVYPYSGDFAMVEDGKVKVTIPNVQEYTEDSFDPNAAFMVAASTGNSLLFKNVQAMLKVALTIMPGEAYTINSITLSSEQSTLSGAATIFIGENPVLTFGENGGKSLQLNCTEGVEVADMTEATNFYLILPPGTYDDLKLKLEGKDGYTTTLDIPTVNIVRNSIVTIKHTCGSDDFTGTIPEMGSTEEDVNP